MACNSTHSVSSQAKGPGVCCAALGNRAPTPGLRFAAKDRRGHCFVCEVATGKRGNLVFKRGKSAGICPTTSSGCCSLAVQG